MRPILANGGILIDYSADVQQIPITHGNAYHYLRNLSNYMYEPGIQTKMCLLYSYIPVGH